MDAMTTAESPSVPGFEKDIRPLFRQVDIDHMSGAGINLDQYSFMSVPENAQRVYDAIEAKRMPPPSEGYTWPEEKLKLLRDWIAGGRQP
jgi:hypothetical protein